MASFDVCASYVLWKYCIPIVAASIVCLYFGIRNVKTVKQLLYFWYMDLISFHDESRKQFAEEALRLLRTVTSSDRKLRNKGIIRVLEIGAGRGSNLIHMQKTCHLIVLEPNRHMYEALLRKVRRCKHVHLERYLEGVPENMSAVSSGSIDAVVATGVMCSVFNLQQTLIEIHRVLAQGGKFIFVEHVAHEEEIVKRLLQKLLDPLWSLVFGGCHINRDIESAIREVPFTVFHCFKRRLEVGCFSEVFLAPTLVGFAIK